MEPKDESQSNSQLTIIIGVIAIVGVIAVMAYFNIQRIRSEELRVEKRAQQRAQVMNLAITRAEALNMAIVAFGQSRGKQGALDAWVAAADEQSRYVLLSPFLAFAPKTIKEYMPRGVSIELTADQLDPPRRVRIFDSKGNIEY